MSDHYLDIAQNMAFWDDCIEIYRESFPEWEREDEAKILQNLRSGIYKMFCYKEESKVLGFYILDVNTQLNYTLFSFLAVKESKRGLGLGSKLCLHAIEYFHKVLACSYLFIEAQERQTQLYAKLGFKVLDIDYRVPAFDSTKSIEMNLMLLQELEITPVTLRPIIKDIFLRGYGLDEDDIRLKEQLQRI